MASELMTLFACGDVMPGRGVDQILPHPGDPELREDYVSDTDAYVIELCQRLRREHFGGS
jgi:poly-gamma-glutamate capsule biosynthesis protein CapA/YwtB (metallophosphatase superfamily)